MNNDNEVLVKVDGVSKKFCRDLKKSLWYGMCDVANELLPIQNSKFKIQNSEDALRPGEFWANKDISFELRRGECIGLIGHNGAGKTTLLKMLNGLIKPDEGTIEMRGRVGALIALGAGFNPILTGRENIYVNGSILGLSKREIDEKIDDIIDFAEIRDFIDTPVQSYSSGMQVRLGFSVATALNPDILILDEVLAVGDAAFRAKCFKRIGTIARNCAIIFVSHDQSQVARICTKALLLSAGRCLLNGSIAEVIDQYNRIQAATSTTQATLQTHESIVSIEVLDHLPTADFFAGNPIDIQIYINSKKQLDVGIAFLNFIDLSGSTVGQADFTSLLNNIPEGMSKLNLSLARVDLAHGIYSVNLAIFAENRQETLVHAVGLTQISIIGDPYMWCSYKMPVQQLKITSAS